MFKFLQWKYIRVPRVSWFFRKKMLAYQCCGVIARRDLETLSHYRWDQNGSNSAFFHNDLKSNSSFSNQMNFKMKMRREISKNRFLESDSVLAFILCSTSWIFIISDDFTLPRQILSISSYYGIFIFLRILFIEP